ncbi:MAG: hypothetical protein KC713_08320, partial [Candidatus Omnitrophica bacterium]|nr:hypothetical protein [Candidatus Omnitrophota bacterium]
GKQIGTKGRDYLDAQPSVEQANQNIQESHVVESALEARKSGATKEEAQALMDAMRSGDQAKADAVAQSLRDRGIEYTIPEAPEEYTAEADDTAWERTKQVGEGMKDQAVRAGTFLKNTAENLGELASSSADIAAKEIHVARQELIHDQQATGLYDRLVEQGADPHDALNAVNEFKDGNFKPLRSLRDEVQKKQKHPDELAQAMIDSSDTAEEMIQWKDEGYKDNIYREIYTEMDATGKTVVDREIFEQRTISESPNNILKENIEEKTDNDRAQVKADDAQKAQWIRDMEIKFGDGWKQTIDTVNQVISQLNKADAQKVRIKTQEAANLLNQLQQGKIDDAEFTNKLDALENEYDTLKQQGQQAWQKIRDQLINGQVNNQPGASGAIGSSGDAATDILNSVPPDQIDQRQIVCDTTSKSGNNTPASISVDMKGGTGTATLNYSLYSVKDRVLVQVNGSTISDTGCTNGSAAVPIPVSGGDQVRVIVQPACEGKSTSWNLRVSCPSGGLPATGMQNTNFGTGGASGIITKGDQVQYFQ